MDKQKVFNEAYLGLKGQNFRQSIDCGVCQYRAPDGCKCAVGHLIPDNIYTTAIEGASVSRAIFQTTAYSDERYALGQVLIELFGEIDGEDVSFLNDLQKCHDNAFGPDDMAERLAVFAQSYGLTIPE